MDASEQLRERLREGGWVPERHSKHEIWKHTNGASYPLSTKMSENGCVMDNSFAAISRLERFGPESSFTAPGQVMGRADGDGTATLTPKGKAPTKQKKPKPVASGPLTWNGWVRGVRQSHSMSGMSVTDILAVPGFTYNHLYAVETEAKPFPPEVWSGWCLLFEIAALPEGIAVPLTTGDLVTIPYLPPAVAPEPLVDEEPVAPTVQFEVPPAPIPEEPEPMTQPAEPETLVVALPAPASERQGLLAQATKLLSNPRLTDVEVQALVAGLSKSVVTVLLGEFNG